LVRLAPKKRQVLRSDKDVKRLHKNYVNSAKLLLTISIIISMIMLNEFTD